MIFLESLLVGVLVWHVISELIHRKERSILLDRLMVRSFEEFKYYEHKFPKDVKIATEATKKMVEQDIAVDDQEDRNTKKFLSGCDEDWGHEAIDKDKLAKLMGVINEPTDNREENPRG